METGASRRNTWLACPGCGHKVARARVCDVEFKCKHCGFEFEVIIGPAAPADPPRSPPPAERRTSD